MKKYPLLVISSIVIYLLGSELVSAQNLDDKAKAELAKALPAAKISLGNALSVSDREGIPVSAGFEMDKGEPNLRVFVKKGERFLQVTVNSQNGAIEEVEPMTSAKDLNDSREQSQAVERATLSLLSATERAVKENAGYQAVGIIPHMRDGRPEADITLLRGQEFKEVTQLLDAEEQRAKNQQNELSTMENREWDPWESFNEKNFEFNRQLDRYALKPVANAYRTVLPEPVRKSIGNALDNLDVVRRLVNNLLQIRFDGAGREVARFAINSTVGVGGLFDVAEKGFHIEPSDRDTGQTLGKYGVPAGPYLVLPFLPPFTVREFFGFVADTAMYPLSYFIPIGAVIGIGATQRINERAETIDKMEGVEENVIDLYGFVRDAYLQHRAAEVRR